ncbi:MAG TPA: energy transducer TonB [Candidatus Sulfotelmatobacter sp.]|jgi:TonB family protein
MARPRYPKQSLKAGIEGTVEIRARIGNDGRTEELSLMSGEPVFANPALEAVRKWRFHPVLIKGQPTEAIYKVRVRYVLILQEAVADVELESPQEPTAVASPSPAEINSPDGPVYRVSAENGVIAPKAIYSPEPEFSEKARKAGEQGNVTLSLIVGTDGKPRDVKVSCSSQPDLNDNAAEALKNWRFEPGTKDGKPVMVEVAVEVQFHLDGLSSTH